MTHLTRWGKIIDIRGVGGTQFFLSKWQNFELNERFEQYSVRDNDNVSKEITIKKIPISCG